MRVAQLLTSKYISLISPIWNSYSHKYVMNIEYSHINKDACNCNSNGMGARRTNVKVALKNYFMIYQSCCPLIFA